MHTRITRIDKKKNFKDIILFISWVMDSLEKVSLQ